MNETIRVYGSEIISQNSDTYLRGAILKPIKCEVVVPLLDDAARKACDWLFASWRKNAPDHPHVFDLTIDRNGIVIGIEAVDKGRQP